MLVKTIYLFVLLFLYKDSFCENPIVIEISENCDDSSSDSDDSGIFEYQTESTTSVKFFLLTPSNDTIELNSTNISQLVNTSQPTKIIVHGLGGHKDHLWVDQMAYAYHTNGNYNVIAIDTLTVATQQDDYLFSVVDTAGVEIGTFIVDLTQTSTDLLSDVHLIGSSVGAQIAGAAGETVAQKGGKVGRITGLDPTVPNDLEILDEDDAEFVDVIHTTVELGSSKIGTVDFYVVDGDGRPICLKDEKAVDEDNSSSSGTGVPCEEVLADDFYILTIGDKTRFEGVSCYEDLVDAVQKMCDKAHSAYMGEYVSRNASGSYLVSKDAAPTLHSKGNFWLACVSALVLWCLCG